MKKVKITATILSPKEKVWKVLWDDATYREWTAVFSSDSHAVSDWKEGSEIKFVDNNGNGMSSIIETKIANQQMSFKHLGELKNGEVLTSDWAGATENYFLSESNGITELTVEMDTNEEFETYFSETFPKAMALIKEISERN